MTPVNIAAGEQVRWLPRAQASDLALPGNDFWLFDDRGVRFNHFTGDGDWAHPRTSYTEDPAVAKLCATAFEAVCGSGPAPTTSTPSNPRTAPHRTDSPCPPHPPPAPRRPAPRSPPACAS